MLVGIEDAEGKAITKVMTREEALDEADEVGMDLVQVGEREDSDTKENIVICKLMDYQKLLYEQKKKEKKNSKAKQEIKEVRINDSTADNDLKFKAKSVDRILAEGNKVKVTITYKGRMVSYMDRGIQKLNDFEKLVTHPYKVDKEPDKDGARVYMVLSPSK